MILRGGAMGEFVFTPPGLDQRLLEEAGFADVRAEDVTENAARVAAASHAAREGRSADLDEVEGAEQNARTQSFLWTVAKLAAEHAGPAELITDRPVSLLRRDFPINRNSPRARGAACQEGLRAGVELTRRACHARRRGTPGGRAFVARSLDVPYGFLNR